MNNKRILITVVLSALVMIGYNAWYFHRYGDVIEANKIATTDGKTVAADVAVVDNSPIDITAKDPEGGEEEGFFAPAVRADVAPEVSTGQTSELDPTLSPDRVAGAGDVADDLRVGEQIITVDSGKAIIHVSNIGAVLTSYQLKEFTVESGEPVELVNQPAELRPLALEFSTKKATRRINKAAFKTEAPSSITLSEGKQSTALLFTYKSSAGYQIDKKITFYFNSYHIDVDVTLTHPTSDIAGSTFSIGWYGLGDNIESFYSYNGPVVLQDGKRLTESPDEDEPQEYSGGMKWAGLANRYYAMAFFTAKDAEATFKLVGEKVYSVTTKIVVQSSGKPIRVSLYAGPKSINELKAEGGSFQKMIYYGWFNVIAKPIYQMLIWFYGLFGNFGWAIIMVTVLLKVLFFPLSQKSFKSMKKMRILSPQIKILQERYKNDKKKQQEEMMALYKRENVNPLAGCLPMVVQIPVFISLYKVLLESIELKGADFIFWLTDLSMKDPYYVTPILMGASMFLQQRFSPQSTDPIQKKVMMFMPVVFTVMFLNFPSGLVVYWLVNNILSIAQQWTINRQPEEGK